MEVFILAFKAILFITTSLIAWKLIRCHNNIMIRVRRRRRFL